MRNTLYKAYLDDFAAFVHRVGGTTSAVMSELLSFEVRVPRGTAGTAARPRAKRLQQPLDCGRGSHARAALRPRALGEGQSTAPHQAT